MHTAQTVRMLQAVATVVGLALLLWSTGLPTFFRTTEAAALLNASDTLSNSAPSQASNHTFQFVAPTGVGQGETIVLTFPTTPDVFDLSNVAILDIDLAEDGVDVSLAASPSGATWGVATTSTTITFTSGTDVIASSATITIEIGDNASFGGAGATSLVNPTATTSYPIDITSGIADSGQVRVAIIDEVTVSASVNASLTFTVTGTTTGITINSSPTTTATDTTSTLLPFGTLVPGTSKVLGQDLSVITNAANGFSVTLEMTQALQSTYGDTIDGFIDGQNTDTPSPWQAPAGTFGDTDTYGHWAVTSTDDDFSVTADRWVAPSTTPREIFANNGPADGLTNNVGHATVGFQAEITALQEAGNDYSTQMRYIATPTF